jgi:hypothetical protein
MQQAMEIIGQAQNGTLTDAQRTQLKELGFTDDQIDQLLKRPQGGRGGFGGERQNSGTPASGGSASVA